MSKAKVKQSC